MGNKNLEAKPVSLFFILFFYASILFNKIFVFRFAALFRLKNSIANT